MLNYAMFFNGTLNNALTMDTFLLYFCGFSQAACSHAVCIVLHNTKSDSSLTANKMLHQPLVRSKLSNI